MQLVFEDSLTDTLDAVNQVFFYGQPLLYAQREQAASWIAGRVGQKDAYHVLPAPTERDMSEGIVLFTGERFNSRASTAHILGEEAYRALRLLGSRQPEVIETQQRVRARLARVSRPICCPPRLQRYVLLRKVHRRADAQPGIRRAA